MWSSGTAARRRTAHLMVTARLGYSMTSGPASHSTIVSAPIGELYDVHSTRMAAPNFAIFSRKLVVPRSHRIVYIPATETPLQNLLNPRLRCITSSGRWPRSSSSPRRPRLPLSQRSKWSPPKLRLRSAIRFGWRQPPRTRRDDQPETWWCDGSSPEVISRDRSTAPDWLPEAQPEHSR